jgi:hypothetical protein
MTFKNRLDSITNPARIAGPKIVTENGRAIGYTHNRTLYAFLRALRASSLTIELVRWLIAATRRRCGADHFMVSAGLSAIYSPMLHARALVLKQGPRLLNAC